MPRSQRRPRRLKLKDDSLPVAYERLESTAPGSLARPTEALPGSPDKLKVLAERAARRQELHVDGDVIADPARALAVRVTGNGTMVVMGTQEVIGVEPGEFTTVKNSAESFGDRLHRLRRKRDWGLKTLSNRTGISPAALCQYENGGRMPILPQLIRLADALEVSLDELVGRRYPG